MENISVILLKQYSPFMAMHDIYFVIVNYICFFLSLTNYSIFCACASFTYMTGCMLLT